MKTPGILTPKTVLFERAERTYSWKYSKMEQEMKKRICLFLALIVILPLWADHDIPRHGLTTHLGGAGSLVEIEYQYRFLSTGKHVFSATAAINTIGVNIAFPLGINYAYGQNDQFLLSLRVMPYVLIVSFDEEIQLPYWSSLLNLRVGYGRKITLFKESLILSVYASPVITPDFGSVFPWAGIGLTQYF